MAKKALICGSVAFDTIMVFGDRFRNHILPDKLHILNVSFLVPQLRREFGGCAGNIAYNLKLLGDAGYPMATVGRDFSQYADWMKKTGVPTDYIKLIETEHTAQGYVTTDLITTRSGPSIPAQCSSRISTRSRMPRTWPWGSWLPTAATA